MNKFLYIFLNIITFGIFGLCMKSKAKKIARVGNNTIQVSNSSNINISAFVDDIGGVDNISFCSSTISTVKIVLNDFNKVSSLNDIKNKYKIKGCIKSSTSITFLFGDNSLAIAKEINELIKK